MAFLQLHLRVTGFDKALTSFGMERGRLPHMYKTLHDTAVVMMLLLHGASRLSLDGYGSSVLPHWVSDDQREVLLHDFGKFAEKSAKMDHRPMLGLITVENLRGRFRFYLLGALC